MNDARQTWLVASREIRERGRSSTFLVSILLMLIAVAGAIVLPAYLDKGAETKDIGLTGTAPTELPSALEVQGESVDTTMRIHRYDTVFDGEEALRDGEVDVLLVGTARLEWPKRAEEDLQAIVTTAIQLVTVRDRAAAAGIDPERLLAVIEPARVSNVELGQTAERGPDDETAAFVMSMVLFGAISTFAAMVLSGVVEEKSSRTVEVLLARLPARTLLSGKIVGIGLLGLAQICAMAAVALIAGTLVDAVDIPAVRGAVLAWAVAWFVLGYALYATLYGTLGARASRTEDASSVSGPVNILLVLGFMVSFATFGSIEALWARLVAWFPFTAPLAMPFRIAMGAATWWDPVVALALTLATIVGLVMLGGRVYTHAILHTGASLSLGDAWRGAPGAVREARTTRSAPTRTISRSNLLVLVVGLAVIVGVGVFLFADDFVMGLVAGTATYAVGKRTVDARRGSVAKR